MKSEEQRQKEIEGVKDLVADVERTKELAELGRSVAEQLAYHSGDLCDTGPNVGKYRFRIRLYLRPEHVDLIRKMYDGQEKGA